MRDKIKILGHDNMSLVSVMYEIARCPALVILRVSP